MNSEKLSQNVESTLKNQYIFWSFMLFGIVFGWLARPPIPTWLLKLFENPIFQYFVLFGIVYTGSKDLKAAFWSPLLFMLIMYLLSLTETEIARKSMNKTAPEAFYNDPVDSYVDVAQFETVGDEDEEEDGEEDEAEAVIQSSVENEEEEVEGDYESFADGDQNAERRRLSVKLRNQLSDINSKTSAAYTDAVALADTYTENLPNGTGNTVETEGFYDYQMNCSTCM